ncbi:MAG: hypothetical protein N4A47_05875 [Clostridia bacterium]|jgi:hypothetical protein|nr:hypothetical protein [Clostridia bacterium]
MSFINKVKKIIENFFYTVEVFEDKEKTKTIDEKIKDINNLFEKLTNYNDHKNELLSTLKELEIRKEKYDEFDRLENSEVHKINALMLRRSRINNRKTKLKDKIVEFNEGISYLRDHEEEMPEILNRMDELDKRQRILRESVTALEVEQDVNAEKNTINRKMFRIINKVSLFAVGFFCLGILTIYLLTVNSDSDLLWPIAIFVAFSIFLAGWLYAFRNRLIHEIKLQKKKQLAEVKNLNKDKLALHKVNREIKIELDKFSVTNLIMLKAHWQEYKENEETRDLFTNTMAEMIKLEQEIDEIIEEKGIEELLYLDDYSNDVVINHLTKSEIKENTKNTIIELNNKIDRLIEEQKMILKSLDAIKSNDITEEQVLAELIDSYISDMKDVFLKDER